MENLEFNIDWQKVAGLIPAIVCENETNEVLMLGYMNKEALNLSLKTGYAHYFSRTKNRIWKKGEESGNTQKIHSIKLDCDSDTLLLTVTQNGGVACHTGHKSCFFREIFNTENSKILDEKEEVKKLNYDIFDELYHIILDRKLNADPQNSYVASLFKKGENAILKKIGEEATEFVMAVKDAGKLSNLIEIPVITKDDILSGKIEEKNSVDLGEKAKNDMVYELSDLFFHSFIALALHNIHPDRIKEELKRRFGMSGIEEKNQRDAK